MVHGPHPLIRMCEGNGGKNRRSARQHRQRQQRTLEKAAHDAETTFG
ncbi:hypothetical protein AmDm5_2336 [Acetobacter malorum]|nr:hypothetical protein AmDm5_2336 [Acetobacter malorum]